MSDTIDAIDAEIAALRAEIVNVERAPLTIAERYAEAHAELRDAERLYQTRGLKISGGHPGETAHLQRQSLIGALMVVNSAALLKVERQRIEQQGEGLTAADKARRLAELRGAILRAAARRELTVREIEGAEFMPRPIHPELFVYKQADVERLAAARRSP